MLGVIAFSIIQLYASLGKVTFWQVSLHIFTIVTVWNLVDLLLIDWLLLGVIQPAFIFMPGTEGLKGYKDFGFHLRGFFKGLAGSIVGSLLIGGITMLISWAFN